MLAFLKEAAKVPIYGFICFGAFEFFNLMGVLGKVQFMMGVM